MFRCCSVIRLLACKDHVTICNNAGNESMDKKGKLKFKKRKSRYLHRAKNTVMRVKEPVKTISSECNCL